MFVIENVISIWLAMLLAGLFLWPQVHYARQTVLHQAALVGIGAYAATFAVVRLSWPWPAAAAAACLTASVSALILAAILARLDGERLSTVSLGFQLILFNLFLVADPLTGGSTGIFFIPPMFSTWVIETIVIGGFAALSLALLLWLPSSRPGRLCRAAGDDALLYETLGGDSFRLKALLGGFAGAGAGLAGAFLVAHLSVAEPALFSIGYSISLVAMVLLLPARPVLALPLAALIFAAAPELLRFIGLDAGRAAYGQQAIFSLVLIVSAFRRPLVPRAAPGALAGGHWN